MVCEELKNGKKVYFVFRAAGTSENTEKRISDRCKYYGVTLIDLELNTTELAARLGKGGEIIPFRSEATHGDHSETKLLRKTRRQAANTKER